MNILSSALKVRHFPPTQKRFGGRCDFDQSAVASMYGWEIALSAAFRATLNWEHMAVILKDKLYDALIIEAGKLKVGTDVGAWCGTSWVYPVRRSVGPKVCMGRRDQFVIMDQWAVRAQ